MFKRVLIANRGEIARRVARTCRTLGVDYVAVFTDADATSPHLEGAIATVNIGAGPAAQSYLAGERIIAAALNTQCDAVHPGYGFLSENSAFAEAVAAAGLSFVGPRPETIAALGDKARAKALMSEAGVPVVPGGGDASEDPDIIERMVQSVGLPVLLKPSAGGGGKGMQVLTQDTDLRAAIASAIRVARSSFGDGRLIVERYIDEPRHIEVQVFGDSHGNVVHLYERECSLQRRHQKVVEEAPAPCLPHDVRQALVNAAVQGARSIRYLNAGTFEFIVGKDLHFYFLEVNTRLQVEHPVTECVTGLDLVEWQLRVASGEPLPLPQDDIRCEGHAVECRVYAEDPSDGFKPAPGSIEEVRWPVGLRVEAGVARGGSVPPFYDPMVAKLVAHAETRDQALDRLREGLGETLLLGLTTNIGYLRRVLADAGVRTAVVHTRYLDEQGERFAQRTSMARAAAFAVAAELRVPSGLCPGEYGQSVDPLDRASLDPLAPWGRAYLWVGQRRLSVAIQAVTPTGWRMEIDGEVCEVHGEAVDHGLWQGVAGDVSCVAGRRDASWELQLDGDRFTLLPAHARCFDDKTVAGAAVAPLAGTVSVLSVGVGDRVEPGDMLAIIEAMKMEHSVVASLAGTVRAMAFAVGDSVKAGELLVDIEVDDLASASA